MFENVSPDFSILLPLYNEEECLVPNVYRVIRFLADHSLKGEILLGSNGSTDATPLIGGFLAEAWPEVVRPFHIDRRGAVGEVFEIAVNIARSPLLLLVDADLSVDLAFIPTALKLLNTHSVVIGSKRSGSQQRSMIRTLASGTFIACARLLLGLPYDDYSMGGKGYRIEAVKPFVSGLSRDTNYMLEIIYRCRAAGFSVVQTPVDCEDRRSSRFNLFKEGIRRFSHLFCFALRARFSKKIAWV